MADIVTDEREDQGFGMQRVSSERQTFRHGRYRLLSMLVALVALLQNAQIALGAGYDWTQFDGNAQHSGNNTQETAIGTADVNSLALLFTVSLPATVDGAPAYLSGVGTATGTRDLLYVTTKDGRILALDAHSGTQIWAHQYGPGACTINNGSSPCYTTSSPAIDPSRQFVYSYGLDGCVHQYQVGSGTETLTSGTGTCKTNGWPELATTKGFDEKGSSALSVATARSGTSYLYVANGGYPGDNGDYQGHLTTINLATGTQHIFNTLCSNQVDVHFVETPGTPDCGQVQSAVWARAGAIYNPDTDRLYIATGNGTYSPAGHDWGDSVLALNPDGTGNNGTPLDSYTPTNYATLQSTDQDLGSTAPAILPVPATSRYPHLAVQGGKDARLRLINLDNLSGQGGPGHTGGEIGSPIGVPQGNEVLTQPAVWVNPADNSTWVFVANDSGMSGLKLTIDSSGNPGLSPQWTRTEAGTSPLVANGILYYVRKVNDAVLALSPTNGNMVLWQSPSIGGIHWQSPIVADGAVYVTDNNARLYAYSIPTSTPTTVTVQAGAGWNMVGGSPLTLWADSQVNWSFNASTPAWYHPTGGEASGTGAWEYVPASGPRTVTVVTCPTSVAVSVVAHRWNLIGNPCSRSVTLPGTARAYWWDPTVSRYAPVSSINPGAAAWIKPDGNTVTLT